MAIRQENLNINFLSNEKVYTIQRKHLISMILPLAAGVAIATILIVAFIAIFVVYPVVSPLFVIGVVLVILSHLILFIIWASMSWFYQFYVITNQRIVHILFFQIRGKLSKEVFFTTSTSTEISRVANNLIYNLLNIEDIYIEFRRYDRTEPFVIRTPDHAQEIEEIMSRFTMVGTGSLKPYSVTAVEKTHPPFADRPRYADRPRLLDRPRPLDRPRLPRGPQ